MRILTVCILLEIQYFNPTEDSPFCVCVCVCVNLRTSRNTHTVSNLIYFQHML